MKFLGVVERLRVALAILYSVMAMEYLLYCFYLGGCCVCMGTDGS